MIVAIDRSIEQNFALILCIDDSDLSLIEENPCIVTNAEFMLGLLSKNGNNAHIFRLQLERREDISGHITRLFSSGFKTVSWVHKGRLFKKENPDARPVKR